MDRRALIKMVTLASGAALTIPLSGTILTACSKAEKVEESSYVLQFFNEEEFSRVKALLDLILPKTDSPSAIEVGVHQTMDHMVGKVYGEQERSNFNSPSAIEVGVHQTMDHMVGKVYGEQERSNFSQGFQALQEYLSKGELDKRVKALVASEEDVDKPAKFAFIGFKQQAVTYYLSTKEIATTYLNFLPIPGVYEPCISLESVDGKAWAI